MDAINVLYADMPSAIRSYVVSNTDSSYTVVLNSRLSHEQNLLSYQHELCHIQNGDYDLRILLLIESKLKHIIYKRGIYHEMS